MFACAALPKQARSQQLWVQSAACGWQPPRYLVVSCQRLVSQQRSVLDRVAGVVDQDGSVLDLQDLDAVSHHRRHAELTQLQRKRRPGTDSQLLISSRIRAADQACEDNSAACGAQCHNCSHWVFKVDFYE